MRSGRDAICLRADIATWRLHRLDTYPGPTPIGSGHSFLEILEFSPAPQAETEDMHSVSALTTTMTTKELTLKRPAPNAWRAFREKDARALAIAATIASTCAHVRAHARGKVCARMEYEALFPRAHAVIKSHDACSRVGFELAVAIRRAASGDVIRARVTCADVER